MGAFGCTIALFLSSLLQLFEVSPILVVVAVLAAFSIALIFTLVLKPKN